MFDLSGRLYISTISDRSDELAREFDLGLEIAEFCTAFNMDFNFEIWDNTVRGKMEGVNRFVFHAPFNELCPAAIDPLIVDVAKKRYAQSCSLMRAYGIDRMIVHSGNVPLLYHDSWFVEHSIEFWKEFLLDKPDNFRLYIENLFETDPRLLCEIVSGVDDERIRICFDIGHAVLFSEDKSVTSWVDQAGRYIGHVHVHNNFGQRDTHNAPGDGAADAANLIRRIVNAAPEASFTIEAIDAETSVKWMKANGFL